MPGSFCKASMNTLLGLVAILSEVSLERLVEIVPDEVMLHNNYKPES